MKQKHLGLTLLELVVIVAIVVMLGFIFVPKLNTLSHDIKMALITSVAASLSALNIANLTTREKNPHQGFSVTNCVDLKYKLPPGYAIITSPVMPGKNTSCVLSGPGNITALFVASGIN